MPEFVLKTLIAAPIERCFDISRSIDVHVDSMRDEGERAVAGVVSGLIGLHQEVTWEARHFGVRQRLTSRITAFERPNYFQDTMVRGAFASFVHDHRFRIIAGMTEMEDRLVFRSPLGPLGVVVDRLVMTRYLRRLLERRNEVLKRVAESGDDRADRREPDPTRGIEALGE